MKIHKWEPDIYIGFSSALHLQWDSLTRHIIFLKVTKTVLSVSVLMWFKIFWLCCSRSMAKILLASWNYIQYRTYEHLYSSTVILNPLQLPNATFFYSGNTSQETLTMILCTFTSFTDRTKLDRDFKCLNCNNVLPLKYNFGGRTSDAYNFNHYKKSNYRSYAKNILIANWCELWCAPLQLCTVPRPFSTIPAHPAPPPSSIQVAEFYPGQNSKKTLWFLSLIYVCNDEWKRKK